MNLHNYHLWRFCSFDFGYEIGAELMNRICLKFSVERTISDNNNNTEAPRSGAQSGSRIYQFGGGGGMETNFQLLLKSKIPILRVGGGGGSWKFDAEFKFAKIQNSHLEGGLVGGGGTHGILMLSPNLLKSKIPILRVGWWGRGGGLMEFWCWV